MKETAIPPLNPIAFSLGPIPVHWYGIIIGSGLALALFLAIREGNKRGLPGETLPDLMIWAIPMAIISARIYYVLFEWGYYSQHVSDIPKIWNGGIAIHGAIIGSVITAYFFAKSKGISFWKIADIAAPSLILGQAIGRWGNFMNQEAHGGPVSRDFLENLHLPKFIINQMDIAGIYYQPTFLYESTWDFAGFILLIFLRRANLRRGEIFLSYLIWYSVGRYFIEGMRTDSLMLMQYLRMAQIISIVLIAIGAAVLIYRRKKGLAELRYQDLSNQGFSH